VPAGINECARWESESQCNPRGQETEIEPASERGYISFLGISGGKCKRPSKGPRDPRGERKIQTRRLRTLTSIRIRFSQHQDRSRLDDKSNFVSVSHILIAMEHNVGRVASKQCSSMRFIRNDAPSFSFCFTDECGFFLQPNSRLRSYNGTAPIGKYRNGPRNIPVFTTSLPEHPPDLGNADDYRRCYQLDLSTRRAFYGAAVSKTAESSGYNSGVVFASYLSSAKWYRSDSREERSEATNSRSIQMLHDHCCKKNPCINSLCLFDCCIRSWLILVIINASFNHHRYNWLCYTCSHIWRSTRPVDICL